MIRRITRKMRRDSSKNVNPLEELLSLGRRRWKIENKGFKEQKSEILNITHIYTKNCNTLKIYI